MPEVELWGEIYTSKGSLIVFKVFGMLTDSMVQATVLLSSSTDHKDFFARQ